MSRIHEECAGQVLFRTSANWWNASSVRGPPGSIQKLHPQSSGKSLDLSILKALFDRGIQCTMQGIHSRSPLKATLGIAVETSKFKRYKTWLDARHPNLPAKSFAKGGVSIAILEVSSIDRNMSARIFAFFKIY